MITQSKAMRILVSVAVALSGLSIGCHRAGPPTRSDTLINSPSTEVRDSRIVGETSKWRWRQTRLGRRERLESVQLVDASTIWLRDDKGTLYQGLDGGTSWRTRQPPPVKREDIFQSYFVNSLAGWMTVQTSPDDVLDYEGLESRIFATTDGGLTWTLQYVGDKVALGRVVFINEQEGWVIGSKIVAGETTHYEKLVMHTLDGGDHWSDVSSGLTKDQRGGYVGDIFAVEAGRATVVISGGRVMTTANGGVSWQQIGAVNDARPQTAMLRLGTDGVGSVWVLGGTGSREGTWSILSRGINGNARLNYNLDGAMWRDAVFLTPTRILACGAIPSDDSIPLVEDLKRENVIVYSSDAGASRTVVYRAPRYHGIHAIAALDAEHVWAVGDSGLVIRLESAEW